MTPRAPAEFAQMAQAIGDEALFALVEAFGGTRVSIPRVAYASHPVAQLLGFEALAALCDIYPASYLRVPLARSWCAQVYRGRGMTNAQIARALHMSERGVYHMLGAARPSPQMLLDLD